MAYHRARGYDSTSGMFLSVPNDVAADDSTRSCLRRAVQALLNGEREDVQQDNVLLSCFFDVLNNHRCVAEPSLESCKAAKTHFLGVLNDYEQRCRDDGDYIMAAAFGDMESTIRGEEEARRVGAEKKDRLAARLRLVAAHETQLAEYNNSWDLCLEEFEHEGKSIVDRLATTHGQQLEALEHSVQEQRRDNARRKWSKELIQLRERQTMLAEQKLYVMVRSHSARAFQMFLSPPPATLKAQETKDKADTLEADELASMNSGLNKSLQMKRGSLLKQQENEANVMAKRIDCKRAELAKRRILDTEKLLLRNRNILKAYDAESRSRCRKIEDSDGDGKGSIKK